MSRLIDYRCQSCGSTDVTFDATAAWDADQQRLVVSNTYDDCYCNSDECQGAECYVAEFDTQTAEALGRAPGSFEYIPKVQADAAWADDHEGRMVERAERDRAGQQDKIISDSAELLAAAHQEIVA